MGRKMLRKTQEHPKGKFMKMTSKHLKKHKEEFETISISDDFEFLTFNDDDNFFESIYFTSLKNTPFDKFKIKTTFYSAPLYIFVSDTWIFTPPKEGDYLFFWISAKDNLELESCIASFYIKLDNDHEIFPIMTFPDINENLYYPRDEAIVEYIANSSINIAIEIVDYINSPKTNIHKEKPRPLNVLAKPQKSNSNDVIYINKREYTYDEPGDNEKRDYERHVKECSVRGHWRRYRDKEGNVKKKVWIEPHKRHFDDGTEENEKTYKI